MNYQESLRYLDELSTFGTKLGLDRIKKLVSYLDNPQLRYKTIHVTGTNGKGSVCSMLSSILSVSNVKTGLYISPHLVSYTERIQIDGRPISEKDFADCISAVKTFVDKMIEDGEECPTQFEVITAAAFLYFAINKVEYAVIEVGLGGLLDSTNVVKPEVCVITNVTFEHANFCGGTLEGIAHHKAGIIKDGVAVVTAAKDKTLDIILEEAEAKNADTFVANNDFYAFFMSFDGTYQHMKFISEIMGISFDYKLKILGDHQIENSSLAIMTASILSNNDERITRQNIIDGLVNAKWPARFEVFKFEGQTCVIDGAHNPAGMSILRHNLDKYFSEERRVILLGILKDKDIDAMLEHLLRDGDEIVITTPDSERKASPEYIAEKIKQHNLTNHIETFDDMNTALEAGIKLAGKEKLLCLTGSLYLTGELRNIIVKRINNIS